MNAVDLERVRRPGSRLPQLSPFEPGEDLKPGLQRQAPVPESIYGCVEWFQYLDYLEEPYPARPSP